MRYEICTVAQPLHPPPPPLLPRLLSSLITSPAVRTNPIPLTGLAPRVRDVMSLAGLGVSELVLGTPRRSSAMVLTAYFAPDVSRSVMKNATHRRVDGFKNLIFIGGGL